MNEFMYNADIPQPIRQKMYRDFKVIDILIDMLKAPFSTPCGRPEMPGLLTSFDQPERGGDVYKVTNAIFLVLESFLKGNSRKNELYIAKHIPFFWNMFGTGVEVEHMFTELIRNNSLLVSMFKEEHAHVVVNLLKGEPNPQYLHFLGALCVCEEVPRRELQDVIGKKIFDGFDPKNHPFLYTTTVDTNDDNEQFVRVTSQKIDKDVCMTLASFFVSAMDVRCSFSNQNFAREDAMGSYACWGCSPSYV
jgi:inositol 1,4,5-triphosphate receptor type 1